MRFLSILITVRKMLYHGDAALAVNGGIYVREPLFFRRKVNAAYFKD